MIGILSCFSSLSPTSRSDLELGTDLNGPLSTLVPPLRWDSFLSLPFFKRPTKKVEGGELEQGHRGQPTRLSLRLPSPWTL